MVTSFTPPHSQEAILVYFSKVVLASRTKPRQPAVVSLPAILHTTCRYYGAPNLSLCRSAVPLFSRGPHTHSSLHCSFQQPSNVSSAMQMNCWKVCSATQVAGLMLNCKDSILQVRRCVCVVMRSVDSCRG